MVQLSASVLAWIRAGYRVVCNLDAVVFHTPWFQKLTPARLYYSQRNIVWVIQKVANCAIRTNSS